MTTSTSRCQANKGTLSACRGSPPPPPEIKQADRANPRAHLSAAADRPSGAPRGPPSARTPGGARNLSGLDGAAQGLRSAARASPRRSAGHAAPRPGHMSWLPSTTMTCTGPAPPAASAARRRSASSHQGASAAGCRICRRSWLSRVPVAAARSVGRIGGERAGRARGCLARPARGVQRRRSQAMASAPSRAIAVSVAGGSASRGSLSPRGAVSSLLRGRWVSSPK